MQVALFVPSLELLPILVCLRLPASDGLPNLFFGSIIEELHACIFKIYHELQESEAFWQKQNA